MAAFSFQQTQCHLQNVCRIILATHKSICLQRNIFHRTVESVVCFPLVRSVEAPLDVGVYGLGRGGSFSLDHFFFFFWQKLSRRERSDKDMGASFHKQAATLRIMWCLL